MIEVEFNLLNQAFRQIFERFNRVTIITVISDYGDNLIVNFTIVDEFHDTENFRLGINTGRKWLVGNQQNVKLIAILIQSLRNKAIVARLRKSNRLNPVEHEASIFAVPLDFVVAASRNLDDDVNFTIFVIPRGQNFIEIGHKTPLVMR